MTTALHTAPDAFEALMSDPRAKLVDQAQVAITGPTHTVFFTGHGPLGLVQASVELAFIDETGSPYIVERRAGTRAEMARQVYTWVRLYIDRAWCSCGQWSATDSHPDPCRYGAAHHKAEAIRLGI
jgi:hypothetical protein